MNWTMIAGGLLCSAGAQVAMKAASRFPRWSARNLLLLAAALGLYGGAFLLYAAILRRGALSRIGPVMTVGVSALTVLAGFLLFGEGLSLRQGFGLGLAVVAVALLLG